MRPPDAARDRATIAIYLLLFALVIAFVGYSARDVIFERFTARTAPTVAGLGRWVYVLGGRSSDGEVYPQLLGIDVDQGRIRQLATLPEPLSGPALIPVPGGLYIVGGHSRHGYVDSILFYRHESRSIVQLGVLPSPRGYAAGAAIGNDLYIVGGHNGERRLAEIVHIDADSRSSEVVGSLPEPRDGLAVAADGSLLYLIGGDGPENRSYDSITGIDPRDGSVGNEFPAPFELGSASAVFADSRLVILTRDRGGRSVVGTLDLVVGAYTRFRKVEVSSREVVLAATDEGVFAVGGAHPTISRQIGIWQIAPDTGVATPMRMPSRVWQ